MSGIDSRHRSPAVHGLRVAAAAFAVALASLFVAVHAAEQGGTAPDPAVQKALAYTMPASTCKPPVERIRSDGNSNALKFERQKHNYTKCLSDYGTELTKDRDTITAALSKGATPDQSAALQRTIEALSRAITAAASS